MWGISALVAPAIGGIFAQYASWRWIFLVNLPIGAVALALILRGLHEQVEHHRHQIDYLGAGLLLVAAGGLILALLEGGTTWAWASVPSIAIFAVVIAAGAAWAYVEKHAREPMLPDWLWSRRLTASTYAATVSAGMITIGLSVYLPNWAQTVLGLSPVAAGFVLAAMSMTWPVTSAYSARLYLRIGFRDTALIGSGFAVCSGLVFVRLHAGVSVWEPVLGSALMGVGMGLFFSPLIVGLQNTVGWSQRGVITGGSMFARYLGQSVGAAVFGAIANAVLRDHSGSSGVAAMDASAHAVFIGVLLVSVASTVLLFAVPRRFPQHSDVPLTQD